MCRTANLLLTKCLLNLQPLIHLLLRCPYKPPVRNNNSFCWSSFDRGAIDSRSYEHFQCFAYQFAIPACAKSGIRTHIVICCSNHWATGLSARRGIKPLTRRLLAGIAWCNNSIRLVTTPALHSCYAIVWFVSNRQIPVSALAELFSWHNAPTIFFKYFFKGCRFCKTASLDVVCGVCTMLNRINAV